MVKNHLTALKSKVGISCSEWSKLSTVPEATIRKILSGETPDPRFETVFRLVSSVGGSMDDVAGCKKESEIENNAVIILKEAYEARIEALRERIVDHKERLDASERDKRMLGIAVAVLVTVIVGMFIFDIALGTHGWVKY